jgi:hypothetical protein
MALNLETDNVGIVIFCGDKQIREGGTVSRAGAIGSRKTGRSQECLCHAGNHAGVDDLAFPQHQCAPA